MWILPKQLITSASAVDTKESALDSEQFCQICEKSLLWRSKPSTSPTWLRRWKKVKFMQHLSIRTLKPSHTGNFVDAWTSSLADSRASHSQLLESVKQLKTPDTFSHISPTESESANLELFSLKTLRESSQPRQQTGNLFCNMFSENWKAWVIQQRQEYSARLKSAQLIRESECLSLAWPTSRASDAVGSVEKNVEMTSTGFKLKRQSGISYGAKLRDAVETYEKKSWATPQVTDVRTDVRTPSERSPKANKGGCKNLREEVMQPQNYCFHQDPAKSNKSGKNQEFHQWATPRANEVHPEITEKNRQHLANRNKSNLEEEVAGHCGKATGKLNPNWVEQMMGLPVGWTQLPTEWID